MATAPATETGNRGDMPPVPARFYYDPAWFELEREAVFKRSWINVGHECELPEPGSFIRFEYEATKTSILIVRGKDGTVRGFHNVCTHRGTQLVEAERGKQATFSCPYHMWTFGTDGALLSAPDFERFALNKADCALKAVRIESAAGLLFANLWPDAPPLREWLGELAPRLEQLAVAKATTFTEYTYEIDANWKLTYDNFQENYHLRFIHPKTGTPTFGKDNPFGYPASFALHGPHRTQAIWSNPEPSIPPLQRAIAGKAVAVATQRDLLAGPDGRTYFALFPNFFLFGSPVQHFLHTVFPLSAEKSLGVIRLYWVGEEASASERLAREHFTAVARDVHAEDRAVIAAGQRGLSSGALEHIHFQEQEALCRHLIEQVQVAVATWQAGG